MFDVFHNLNNRRMAVPFTAIMAMAVLLIVSINRWGQSCLLRQYRKRSCHDREREQHSDCQAKEAPHVLRVDGPAIEIASATYEILEEIA
jgi:hypothetical protein